MSAPFSWPAFEVGRLPRELPCERAVWGKVHGAASDYRWIARSPGFEDSGSGLVPALNLGIEDQVQRGPFWRVLGSTCLAGVCYASHATDAFGRAATIEKQLLLWQRPPDVPAAFGALVLLPRIFPANDEIWWERAGDARWRDPEFSLALPAEVAPVPTEEALGALIERGCRQVADLVESGLLEQFYLDLLEHRRPALLGALAQPLGPEGLAALLLPLPRALADSLSLAGWLPSSRFDPVSLGQRWGGLCVPQQARGPAERGAATAPKNRQSAMLMAGALLAAARDSGAPLVELTAHLSGPAADERQPPIPRTEVPETSPEPDPALEAEVPRLPRPFLPLPLKAPPDGSPAIVKELYEWARDPYRRQQEPLEQILQRWPSHRIALGRGLDAILRAWPDEVRRNKPTAASDEQWQEKVRLLEAKVEALLHGSR